MASRPDIPLWCRENPHGAISLQRRENPSRCHLATVLGLSVTVPSRYGAGVIPSRWTEMLAEKRAPGVTGELGTGDLE